MEASVYKILQAMSPRRNEPSWRGSRARCCGHTLFSTWDPISGKRTRGRSEIGVGALGPEANNIMIVLRRGLQQVPRSLRPQVALTDGMLLRRCVSVPLRPGVWYNQRSDNFAKAASDVAVAAAGDPSSD